MKLEKLHIKNYKSLVDLEIIKPNPFTVFAGPNGAGKSNIFEALEYFTSSIIYTDVATRLEPERLLNVSEIFIKGDLIEVIESEFGGHDNFVTRMSDSKAVDIALTGTINMHGSLVVDSGSLLVDYDEDPIYFFANLPKNPFSDNIELYKQFYHEYSRIFIGNKKLDKLQVFKQNNLSKRLFTSADNLEKVLKRLLEDEIKREYITEYLEMFIPGLNRIEVNSNNRSGTNTLHVYEKGIDKPFTKDLISDGTYNILCLLTAVFQSDGPQFLCIEEPENGLNPYVVQEFVELCRLMCEDHGHYIWLNTHSQTLVRALREEELILVDKENGATKIKQFEKGAFHGLKADEAWLTNSLGAGIPW